MLKRSWWFIALDFIASFLGWQLFYYLRKNVIDDSDIISFDWFSAQSGLLIAAFWVTLFLFIGHYKDFYHRSRISDLFKTFALTVIGGIVIFFTALLDDQGINHYLDYYKSFGIYLGTQTLLILTSRLFSLTYAKHLLRRKKVVFNTLVIGSNERSLKAVKELKVIANSLGLNIIGYTHVLEGGKTELLKSELRHWGGIEQIPSVIRRCNVSKVIIAMEPSENQKIVDVLGKINTNTIQVSLVADTLSILTGKAEFNHPMGIPMVNLRMEPLPLWQHATKRTLDLSVSSLAIVLGLPFLLIVSLITKFSSKGPVFYSQERIGRYGKPFMIIKFRSMHTNSEGSKPQLSSNNDSRITKWGKIMRKTRIDELPQFINVLKGNMSLVGPRPERAFFVDQIKAQVGHYERIQQIRPGITSLGQVKYGYAENVAQMIERLEYEMVYLEGISLAMDFRIILSTLLVVVQGRGK